MNVLVAGGCGFIGSNLVRFLLYRGHTVVNIDKLTYSGNATSLADLRECEHYFFVHGDILNKTLVLSLMATHKPQIVFNLAAESHVDRSIDSPVDFVNTNFVGTFLMLEAAKEYYASLDGEQKTLFRFLQISTDEVFGSLTADAPAFNERTPYAPSSPYSATKAGADHLAKAYYTTYRFPAIVTNCSNNYGPYQFPEKLIPMMIESALAERSLPIYGDGLNIRDWLYVDDHCEALLSVALRGRQGGSYTIGGRNEKTNLEVVTAICNTLDEFMPRRNGLSYSSLITYVADRPGHDRRYAIDCSKIEHELDWKPKVFFEQGIRSTVRWYLDNRSWVQAILDGTYQLERLGCIS